MQGNLQQWFDHLAPLIPTVPKGVWVAAYALPIILAVFSTRTGIILGSILAVSVSGFGVLEPRAIFLIVAVGAYLGGILVGVFGIQARRRDSAVRDKLATLGSKLMTLKQAEERQFFTELRKDKNENAEAEKPREQILPTAKE